VYNETKLLILKEIKMTPKSIIKPIVLTTVELGTTFAVGHMLNKAITTAIPDLGLWNEGMTRKENAIHAAKLIGVAVGIALVAGAVATVVTTTTERIIWNDTEEIEQEN
jgi:uncharacterized membrane protein